MSDREIYMQEALRLAEEAAACGDVPVTLEPCPMCAGAIINARIPELVFGAREENSGSCGSVIDLFAEKYGHSPKVYTGVCAMESRRLLREFFEGRR